MARYVIEFTSRAETARKALEERARVAVRRVFGWKPHVVRANPGIGASQGVCSVEVRLTVHHTFEFWVSGDHLVNIPPRNRR
jgi:hypothetical protein